MTEQISTLASQLPADLGRVVVLYGGWSGERDVSLKGGEAVLGALRQAGIDAVGLDAGRDWLGQIQVMAPDRVFIMLHGRGGEDGQAQGALESLGLPYTGSGVLASALAMDKLRCKQLWRGIGLPTPAFHILNQDSDWDAVVKELGGSVMVKPASEGSSLGMSKADSADQLEAAWRLASEYDDCVLAERWLSGAEYTVAVVNGRTLPTIRLETQRQFYDYQAKYEDDDTRYLCPCGLSAEEEAQIQDLALDAYQSLGCSGWGRVDLMATGDTSSQSPFCVLEVNTVPGMTDHSLVPMAAAVAGMSFEQLVVEILLADECGVRA
ncbi:MAG TPA: D-alanine--D-alanine ligase [Porticoccaceae bacterium]|nr:D-alanine--D-alanine ligase [Porticoccaceae bacterium]